MSDPSSEFGMRVVSILGRDSSAYRSFYNKTTGAWASAKHECNTLKWCVRPNLDDIPPKTRVMSESWYCVACGSETHNRRTGNSFLEAT